jgi:hypothetical protein
MGACQEVVVQGMNFAAMKSACRRKPAQYCSSLMWARPEPSFLVLSQAKGHSAQLKSSMARTPGAISNFFLMMARGLMRAAVNASS